MRPVDLILAVHNHQPVGNFEHVIEDAYQAAYRPFLEVLERHPSVRFVLHQPGLLWEWTEERHPEYLERVRRLLERGQIELLSGGFYEPILSVIPEVDRQGQLAAQQAWLWQHFGVRPRGAWLAERVWEPELASSLARAGLEYTVLDDAHFLAAGLPATALDGDWMTEDDGLPLRVFPIQRRLRYLIPFAPPEESIAWLRARGEAPAGSPHPLYVLADDGEKFGVWSHTHDLCYVQGWLERFCVQVEENAAWLRTTTFAEALATRSPRGRTYLPAASYTEMMQWALPVEAQRQLQRAVEHLRTLDGDGEALQAFVRGGFWRNFLAKYPESNWMHKRMLAVSRAVQAQAAAPGGDVDAVVAAARLDLWRAQCNCAYWHGLFGGLYLPHLRSAVYRHLVRAETALERREPRPRLEGLDVDADGRPEVVLRSEALLAVVKPDEGGAIFELDDRVRAFNLVDLMTRREEAYHDRLRRLALQAAGEAADSSGAGAAVSIHDLVAVKEAGLENRLVYDAYRRGACIDHALGPDADLDAFAAARLPEVAALAGAPYAWRLDGDALHLERRTPLLLDGARDLIVRKRLHLHDRVLEIDWALDLEGEEGEVDFRFGVEMAASLLAGDAPDRWYEIPEAPPDETRLASRGVSSGVRRLDLVDAWLGVRLRFETDTAGDVWRVPIETVSNSESGFERVYQGSALLFVSRVQLAPGATWRRRLRLEVGDA